MFGEFKIVLVLVGRAGNEAEEIGIEKCHCTTIPQKGRCHLAMVTGYTTGLRKHLRAARLPKDAILLFSDQFYSYISCIGQCVYTVKYRRVKSSTLQRT